MPFTRDKGETSEMASSAGVNRFNLLIRSNIAKADLTHEAERMSTEIPIWVNGKIRWLSGIDKKTTCKDVVEALLEGEGIDKSEVKDFVIMERWRKVERPLDETSKILRIWSHWGNEKKEVRLCLRHIDNEVDSGRGSPINNGHTPSLRRKRNRARGNGKPPWAHPETLHPRRLVELGKFSKREYDDYYHAKKQSEANDESERLNDIVYENKYFNYDEINNKMHDIENINCRKKSGHKSYHCSSTGRLHSTPISNSENHTKRKCCSKRESKQKVRNSENIEKLMKLILAQGATIQSQLQKLKEREEQIESLEHERHRERIEKNGRNYLLETYLGSLKDAEIPTEMDKQMETVDEKEKEDSMERLKQNETEPNPEKDTKIYGRRPGNRIEDSCQHQKNTRSKSESRTQECKLDGSLKRTLSENALAENVVASSCDKKDNTTPEGNAKEESDVIELKRIQSQIEMWEKVFKINKKLEKEEENLVRLHIKIKKFQSENYRLAKDTEINEEAPPDNSEPTTKPDTEEEGKEQDTVEIHKDLENLRTSLEQNSKEIYQNFTKLIEDDDIVEQKRTCLTKLMSDLERTDHEHEMLSEMIAMREQQTHDEVTSFCENPNDISLGLPPAPVEYIEKLSEVPSDMCSSVLNLPYQLHDEYNQRTETEKPQKPKIVKISFEDQIPNHETTNGGPERLPKVPVPATGALKSILKNKKFGYNKELEKPNEPQYMSYNPPSVQQKNGYVQAPYNYPSDVPNPNFNYSYAMQFSIQNQYPPISNGQSPKYSEDFKTAYPLRNPPVLPKPPSYVPHSTMVTTKALVHNDTDSSTSSDTSGLSSMYSSSPTVEEHYVEQGYVLDTLV